MPGMATEDELANLRSLQGTAFDVEFLRLMIRHHQGGLEMAQYAAAHGETDVVRTLATSIADSQTAETRADDAACWPTGAAPRCRSPEGLRPAAGRRLIAFRLQHGRAPVAQGIEHCPPEAGAQVRILPGALFRFFAGQLVSMPPSTGIVVPVT